MIPLGDRVLVKPSTEEVKRGLIVIPDSARSRPQEGEVIAVGPKVKELKVGDRVLFGKYVASEVGIGEVVHLILRESDVMGIL